MWFQRQTKIAAIAALLVAASGCADDFSVGRPRFGEVATIKVSGKGQNVPVSHPGRFDLEVSGDGNTVRVPAGSTIRTLTASGVGHSITVSPGASVQTVRLSGVRTTIHLPADSRPSVTQSGVDGRVLHDVESAPNRAAP